MPVTNIGDMVQTTSATSPVNGPTSNNPHSGETPDPTGEGNNLVFPSDIETIGHWITFNSFEYSRASRSATAPRMGPFKSHIVLPLPADFKVGYGAEYSNESLGYTGYAAAAMAQDAADAYRKGQATGNMRGSYADAIQKGIGDALQNAPGVIAGTALDAFRALGGVGEGISVGLGVSKNPHIAVLYKSPRLREHEFAYTFAARNEQESSTLQQIIKTFKTAMHPNYADASFMNHLFKYPDEWLIQVEESIAPYLFRFRTCVLTNFTVNYHAAGTPSYFETTGAPTTLTMHMSFLETEVNTQEEMKNGF